MVVLRSVDLLSPPSHPFFRWQRRGLPSHLMVSGTVRRADASAKGSLGHLLYSRAFGVDQARRENKSFSLQLLMDKEALFILTGNFVAVKQSSPVTWRCPELLLPSLCCNADVRYGHHTARARLLLRFIWRGEKVRQGRRVACYEVVSDKSPWAWPPRWM